jgi:predicted transcriptional regulator
MTDQPTNNRETASIELASDIVAAYVAHNSVPRTDLAALIVDVHATIERLRTDAPRKGDKKPVPPVPIKRSVSSDHIICLEDGKKFKSLKRHLSAHYGLTPDEYRAKWGLPPNYPMVAATYAATRSALAKRMGLGRKREEQKPAPADVESNTKRKRAMG